VSRKPPGASWESWIDQIIREGRERGEFDNLAGEGKPIGDLHRPHDDLWWVRRKLQSEGVSFLPPTLALRKDKEDVLALVDATNSEVRVRQLVEALNERIGYVNRTAIDGPPSTVVPVDVDEVVAGWRQRRAALAASAAEALQAEEEPVDVETAPTRSRWPWWRRRPA
jgi:hypothetical protein